MESEAITNANPIAVALRYWPADRFPKQDYAAFWCWKFKDYPPHVVAEAIGVLIMESDPFAPTCEEVTRILERLGMKPDVAAWDKLNFLRVKAERDAIKAQQDEDDAICNAMSDATFETLARAEIAKFDADVQAFRCYSPHRKVDDLRRSKHLTSLVAAHARVHGLVRGGLFQEASR